MTAPPKKMVSIYAGGGTTDREFHKRGWKTVLAIDHDAHSRQLFALNNPGTPILDLNMFNVAGRDILRLAGVKKSELDLLITTPPCTGGSSAGKRIIFAKVNRLFVDSAYIIRDVLPKRFILENVPGMIRGKMAPLFHLLRHELDKLPYRWDMRIMNCLDFGAASDRRRIILHGVRNDVDDGSELFPATTTVDYDALRIQAVLPHVKEIRYGYGWVKVKPRNAFANTLTKNKNFKVLTHEEEFRYPRTREAMDLQGYPEDSPSCGSENQMLMRIGNSVSPKLAVALADHLSKFAA